MAPLVFQIKDPLLFLVIYHYIFFIFFLHVLISRRLLYWDILPFLWPLSFVVQPFSCGWLSMTPWTAACQASLTFTISWSLPRLTSIESMIPSNHLILCCPLLLLPSIFPSIRVFSNESVLHIRWPASVSVLPVNVQYWFLLRLTGLISLQSRGLRRDFSKTTVQKPDQFFGV